MRLVDDHGGLDLLRKLEQTARAGHRHDADMMLFQRLNQFLLSIRAVDAGQQHDWPRCIIFRAFRVEIHVFFIVSKTVFLFHMKKRFVLPWKRRFGFRRENPLAMDFIADVVDHPAEILLTAAEIETQLVELGFRERADSRLLFGGGRHIDRRFQIIQNFLLFIREIQPHAEENNGVKILQLLTALVVPWQDGDIDGFVELLVQQWRQDVFRIIDEGDVRRCAIAVERDSRRAEKQCDGGV